MKKQVSVHHVIELVLQLAKEVLRPERYICFTVQVSALVGCTIDDRPSKRYLISIFQFVTHTDTAS